MLEARQDHIPLALERRISVAVYRRLLARSVDELPGRSSGNDSVIRVTGSTP